MKTVFEYWEGLITAVYRESRYEEKEISFFVKASFAYCIHAGIPLTC